MKENPEIELTLDDITQGASYTRSIVLESKIPTYDGKTIKYRTLTADEMAAAMKNAKIGRGTDPGDNITLLIEICKVGIVTAGVGKAAGKLPSDVVTAVGAAILGVSQPAEADVEAMFQKS